MKLEVSIGEALDKLSILEIKKRLVKDAGDLKEVEKEYDAIYPELKEYLDKSRYFYQMLVKVNQDIWDNCEPTRVNKDIFTNRDKLNEYAENCYNIITYNDQRFRLKNKINTLCMSNLKEKCAFFGHIGCGDMMTMNGLIRYLSTLYDEVCVACDSEYAKTVETMYSDDPAIKLILVKNSEYTERGDIFKNLVNKYKENGYKVICSGKYDLSKYFHMTSRFFKTYYAGIGYPYNTRYTWEHVCRDLDKETELFNKVVKKDEKYIFVHRFNGTSFKKAGFDNRGLFTYEPNHNFYVNKKHEFYGRWSNSGGMLSNDITHYGKLIENAEELVIWDSSFFCYSMHLDLSKVKKKTVFVRNKYNIREYHYNMDGWLVINV